MTDKEKKELIDDISSQMAEWIATMLNVGEFKNEKWSTDAQRNAWLKAVEPFAEEIAVLRIALGKTRRNIFLSNGKVLIGL